MAEPVRVAVLMLDCLTFHALQRMKPGKGRKGHWFGKWILGDPHVVEFTNAFSVAHCSDPNYVSMLTGLYAPDEGGVYQQVGRDCALKDLKFVQEDLKGRGYTIVSVGAYQSRYFLRGVDFSWWTDAWDGAKSAALWRRNQNQLAMRALNLVDPLPGPWFLFLRTMFQHAPRAGGSYFGRKGHKSSLDILSEQMHMLLKCLRRKGDVLIVIMADHGDMGGAPKGYKVDSALSPKRHRRNLVEPLIHVPCVVWSPRLKRRSVSAMVQPTVDFLPTLYAYLGLEHPWKLSGVDMLSADVLAGRGRRYAYMAGCEVDHPHGWQFRAVRAADGGMYRVLLSPGAEDKQKLIEEPRGIAKEPGRFLLWEWIQRMKADGEAVQERRKQWGGCDRLDQRLAEKV